MKIKLSGLNHNQARYQIKMQQKNSKQKEISKFKTVLKEENKKLSRVDKNYSKRLEKEAEKFTAVFMEKMFSAMKKTLPEEKLFDGGFAEDVFSDMLTKEYSQMAGKQGTLADLNRKLVKQLKNLEN